jgi:hypothetical protein
MNSVESTFCGREEGFLFSFAWQSLNSFLGFLCVSLISSVGGEKITLPQVMSFNIFIHVFIYLLCIEGEEGYLMNTRDAFHSPSCLETT